MALNGAAVAVGAAALPGSDREGGVRRQKLAKIPGV